MELKLFFLEADIRFFNSKNKLFLLDGFDPFSAPPSLSKRLIGNIFVTDGTKHFCYAAD